MFLLITKDDGHECLAQKCWSEYFLPYSVEISCAHRSLVAK